ncbi:MAG: KpsF/GutQ family sugar-phosphate isomerase, partial [Acidobacteria bacterium]
EEDYARLHPGGKLGKKLMKVSELMRKQDAIPRVYLDTPMKDVIYEMSKKGLGITAVLDKAGQLAGVISDGDLRRHLEKDSNLLNRKAADCMTLNPKTIAADELATRALNLMEEKKITSLFILDERGGVQGIIHLHDLWRTELF